MPPRSPAPLLQFGLTGDPLGHSLSPRLHETALRETGLSGEYKLYPAPPLPEGAQALQELLARMRMGELSGLNVTIPHKQTVMNWLDELTPAASAIGAVNTIFLREGALVGDNTDAPGFLADLERCLGSRRSFVGQDEPARAAIILGAGGSARAAAYALLHSGWQVFVAARRLEQAQELAEALSMNLEKTGSRLQPDDWKENRSANRLRPRFQGIIPISLDNLQSTISNQQSSIRLLVNATPLGMAPSIQASPWPAGVPFPDRAVVYDLVYNPPETLFLRTARAAGLPGFSGSGMLVEQAALAFERWTGVTAPRPGMHAAMKQAGLMSGENR
jgi:shikimate dehydrogenase